MWTHARNLARFRCAALVLPLSGCAALLDFEVSEDAAGGGPPAGATTGAVASSGGTDGSGGSGVEDCPGCVGDLLLCHSGETVDTCGRDGQPCTVCPRGECLVPSCDDGVCGGAALADGTACTGGLCTGGACIPNENCLDGLDDDDDGAVDCDDPDCATFAVCTPAVPDGFSGPMAVYEGGDVACPVDAWQAELPVALFNGILPGSATCPTCGCGTLCSMMVVHDDDATCTFAAAPGTESVPAGGCADVPYADGDGKSVRAQGTTNPQCVVQTAGEVVLGSSSFASTVTACIGTVASTCAGGSCLPRVPAQDGTTARLCVGLEGEAVCGAPWSEPFVAHQGLEDQRTCTACSCTAPASCGGVLSVFTDPNCTTCDAALGSCADLGATECDAIASGPAFMGYVNQNDCTPVPSAVGGAVVGTGAWTFCCLPGPN